MQRVLTISKYRNIGLEKPETLIINHSIKKGEIGGLVILIGANNSGKSNVLDALMSVSTKRFSSRDITTLSFSSEDRVPKIDFGVRNNNNSIFFDMVYGETPKCQLNIDFHESFSITKEILENDVRTVIKLFNKSININFLYNILEKIQRHEGEVTQDFADEIVRQIDRLQQIGYSDFGRNMPDNGYWKYYHLHNPSDPIGQANRYCQKNFGIKFFPSIFKYKEMPLTKDNLQSQPSEIQKNLFFRSLFKAIGVDPDEISNAYEQYREFHNPATLNKIKKKLDEKIKVLNKQFNNLYFAESDEYKFTISLGDNSIAFGMARGKDEDPIMLDYQSTGFKWFFNFFFNFIGSSELQPGDIIVMDEPATNLHPKGQQELHSFMKQFAHKNDLTFIIATHSPFLIDPDNYDELRVISMENNLSKIDNLFTAVNYEDPDSLLPIKESLTIEQNVLYNLDTEVVWVEGITDYNYLTMFKKLLGEKNIAFLPCNGIGNNEKYQQRVLERLLSIKFHKYNLLVDGDKAGQKMKEACKGTALGEAISVSDLNHDDKKFVEIEDLFSEEDRKKYSLPSKSAGSSYIMKTTSTLDSFTPETIENFKKLFELIKD